jgi:hypothetical protein
MYFLKKTSREGICENCGKKFKSVYVVALTTKGYDGKREIIDLTKSCKGCLAELKKVAGNPNKAKGISFGSGRDYPEE